MANAIDQLAGKVTDILAALQGPGLEVAKAAARTTGYSNLVADALAVLIGAGLSWAGYRAFKKDPDLDNFLTVALVVLGALGAFIFIVGIVGLCDPWLYVTLAHPEQWIAKKALGL